MMKWLKEWYMIAVPALALLAVIVLPFILITPSTTMSVPVEFCKAQYTGRTQIEDVPIQTCAAYDASMNCTVPITSWVQETRNETRVTCDWVEWR